MSILATARLRANPEYELVALDRLDGSERELIDGPEGEERVYGVLVPRTGSSLDARTASPDTALLFLTLGEAAPLPEYARRQLGGDLDRTLGRLVLDGVFEVEHAEGWLCGPGAAALLAAGDPEGGRGRIGELSMAALRYGQELGELEEPLLALRLYLYGRLPIGPALRARWPDAEAVAAHLGLARGGRAAAALAAGWIEAPQESGTSYWRTWRPRGASQARPGGGSNYKLYVSPSIEALPAALEAVADVLRGAPGVAAFKVGEDVAGVCRPDKLVAYFDRLEDLHEAAGRLRERLAGCPAHGVPFTAAISGDGLLSWGADPPPATSAGRSGSWRLWVAQRLAEYLLHGRRADDGPEPWRFALERLRLAGIDTDTWAPRSGMWPTAEASA